MERNPLPIRQLPYSRNEDNLIGTLKTFWDTEAIGIVGRGVDSMEEHTFLREVSFEKQECRYQVGLPWKTESLLQSNGYLACVRRLRQLHSYLKKNKQLLHDYDNVIMQQLEDGIIEVVPKEEDSMEGSYYLPYHEVIREDKKTATLCVVFDGSAKPNEDSPSINKCLEKKLSLVPNLFDTVTKFRSHSVGLLQI